MEALTKPLGGVVARPQRDGGYQNPPGKHNQSESSGRPQKGGRSATNTARPQRSVLATTEGSAISRSRFTICDHRGVQRGATKRILCNHRGMDLVRDHRGIQSRLLGKSSARIILLFDRNTEPKKGILCSHRGTGPCWDPQGSGPQTTGRQRRTKNDPTRDRRGTQITLKGVTHKRDTPYEPHRDVSGADGNMDPDRLAGRQRTQRRPLATGG